MALCISLIHVQLFMHSKHGHDGVFSCGINYVLTKTFFCTH